MAGALLCILLELYFLAPAAMGIWHVGMLYPMVPLTLLSVWLSCPRLFDRLPRWLCRAVAAVVGGLIFAGTRFIPLVEEQDVCVAYVGGERITDPTRVMNEAHNALQATQKPADEANVEHALNDMFATINEP